METTAGAVALTSTCDQASPRRRSGNARGRDEPWWLLLPLRGTVTERGDSEERLALPPTPAHRVWRKPGFRAPVPGEHLTQQDPNSGFCAWFPWCPARPTPRTGSAHSFLVPTQPQTSSSQTVGTPAAYFAQHGFARVSSTFSFLASVSSSFCTLSFIQHTFPECPTARLCPRCRGHSGKLTGQRRLPSVQGTHCVRVDGPVQQHVWSSCHARGSKGRGGRKTGSKGPGGHRGGRLRPGPVLVAAL